VLSDVYLEAFKGLVANDRVIEVFYEDFVADPKRLVKRIYDVLGLSRPKGGLRYVDLTKIRRQATSAKLQSEADFKDWLLENNHSVVTVPVPEPALSSEVAQAIPSAKAHSDLRLAVAQEHADELAFFKGRVAALQREVERLKRHCETISVAGERE
jgi:hypothetical protein